MSSKNAKLSCRAVSSICPVMFQPVHLPHNIPGNLGRSPRNQPCAAKQARRFSRGAAMFHARIPRQLKHFNVTVSNAEEIEGFVAPAVYILLLIVGIVRLHAHRHNWRKLSSKFGFHLVLVLFAVRFPRVVPAQLCSAPPQFRNYRRSPIQFRVYVSFRCLALHTRCWKPLTSRYPTISPYLTLCSAFSRTRSTSRCCCSWTCTGGTS